jgi:hypothetical protein
MGAAVQVKPDVVRGQTAQGFYVLGPDGSAYGFNNNRSVEGVHKMLDFALAAYKERPPAKADVSDADVQAPFSPPRPPGALAARVLARVKPVPEGCAAANENVARDHLWILAGEQQELTEGRFPVSLARRIARFSLVDNVRGEPDHWHGAHVRSLKTEPLGEGRFRLVAKMQTDDGARGLEADLTLRVKSEGGRVTAFDGYATATAWGRSTYTPDPPPGRFPMAFAVFLSNDDAARAVPPQAVFWGREYLEP